MRDKDGPSLARWSAMLMIGFFACGTNAGGGDEFQNLRAVMVDDQIAARGIREKAVLEAMRTVPRHQFVPAEYVREAYADYPLPIGYEQTISQPYIVAYMTEALAAKKGHKVLEIGTGSGYQAAVLAAMGVEVYSIEIVEPLAQRAGALLKKLGYKVHVRAGDGHLGWPQAAPFDGIIVTAAPLEIPPLLIEQLKDGGTMVIPVGRFTQDLKVMKKLNGKLVEEKNLPVRFVPMTGKASP